MISVEEALTHLFSLVAPTGHETVPLLAATGRVLAEDVVAGRWQPPFAASAMDGYAVRAADCQLGAELRVIGESAAGHRFDGVLSPGEAVRIFTGAPVPEGADTIVIQENVTREGAIATLTQSPGDGFGAGHFIRPAGADFQPGARLSAPRVLSPNDIALIAAMGHGQVRVARRPDVALIATGDELVPPGSAPGPDQIIASNSYGLHGLLSAAGAAPRLMPIAGDSEGALTSAFRFAREADLVITIGGASVGDHDLVGPVAEKLGLERRFYKIAMRPGKPLMAGRMAGRMGGQMGERSDGPSDGPSGHRSGGAMMVGLPGNPVSAMVCGQVFLVPVVRAMLGLPARARVQSTAPLATALEANGPREHYMRAQLCDGLLHVAPRQDSALLSVLSDANALVVRPPHDPAQPAGAPVAYLPL